MALVDWHLTPEYINENWTEELIGLMLTARWERIQRYNKPVTYMPGNVNDGRYKPEHHKDATTLFGKMAGYGSTMFKVTKR